MASPSEIWKERAGLPIAAPHVARVSAPAPAHLEHTLAAPRFVALADALGVPRDRVRQVSAYVEEFWSPVYERTESTDIATILRASETQVGWQITQRPAASTRARTWQSAEQFVEVAQSAQIQATDEFYNGHYPTIVGNDPVIVEGEVLRAADGAVVRGGTMIRGGRKEYGEKTKSYVHWDEGVAKAHFAAHDEMCSRPVRNVRTAMDAMAGEVLPTRRLIANPRTDRQRAV